jgi:hypothetical protein
MSTFGQAIASVGELTRRGTDRAALIKEKINAAVRFISSAGRFPQDLWEEVYSGAGLTVGAYVQHLTLPVRTRQVAYIQDPARPDRIDLREYAYILDRPSKVDVAYQAGNALHLRLKEVPSTINLGVYRLPALLIDNADTNWIVQDMYDLVVDYATTWVLVVLGEKEIAGNIAQMSAQQFVLYVQDRISTIYGTV